MKILHAIGWGLFILIVRNAMPEVFGGFTHTLVMFFQFIQAVLVHSPTSFNL